MRNRKLITRYEAYEGANYKVFEDELATVFFWIIEVFNLFISIVFGVMGPEEDLVAEFLFLYGLIAVGAMGLCAKAIYTVREGNNLRANIYEKLRFVPVDLKVYCMARICRMAKHFARYSLIIQLVVLAVHLMRFQGLNPTFYTFAPLCSGVIMIGIQGLIEYDAYWKVVKNV